MTYDLTAIRSLIEAATEAATETRAYYDKESNEDLSPPTWLAELEAALEDVAAED